MFEQQISDASLLLDQFELGAAEKALIDIKAINLIQERIRCFYWGRLLLRQGKATECIEFLLSTIKSYGSHVSILSELTAAYYMIGDHVNFTNQLRKTEEAYRDNHHKLSYLSLQRTELALAKHHEINGNVFKAQLNYEKIVCRLASDDKISAALCKAMAQLLRLEAEYFSISEFKGLYFKLGKLYLEVFDKNFSIEIEHSLMIAEFQICNPELAVQRCLSILERPELLKEDADLVVADLVYLHLSGGLLLPQSLIEVVECWHPESFEDKIIKSHVLNLEAFDFKTLLHIKKSKLNTATQLRLLLLGFLHNEEETQKNGYWREIQVALNSLDESSRGTWETMIAKMTKGQKVNLVLNLIDMTLTSTAGEVLLKNRKPAFALIKAISTKDIYSNAEVVEKIWGVSWYDDTYFHRLRMQVKRLNLSIFTISSVKEAIVLDAKNIKLSPEVGVFIK